jgi:outer membrane protein assembly factor BamB
VGEVIWRSLKTWFAMLLGVTVSVASDTDWPQFRGPQANGTVEDAALPGSLDPARHLVWRVDLPGRGLSSPIVVGDLIFVTCSSGSRQDRLHVLCFNRHDGSLRWERRFRATGRTMCHEKTSVAAPTPASDGTYVFALYSSNDLVCLDLEGNLVWLRGLTVDYPNASNSLGMASSLVVTDGVVVAQIENDSESYALGIDSRTGLNRWKLERPKLANWTSPVVWHNGSGRPQVLLQSGKGLTAVEPSSGRVVWDYREGASTVPSTAAGGAVLYVPSNGLTALAPGKSGESPQQLWRSNQLRPSTPSPVVLRDRVYSLNDAGVLTCGDAETGKRLWQLRLKGPFSATPVASGRFIYAFNESGLGQVVDPTAPEGEVVSEVDLQATILSTPAISRGSLLIRSDRHLWRFGARTP